MHVFISLLLVDGLLPITCIFLRYPHLPASLVCSCLGVTASRHFTRFAFEIYCALYLTFLAALADNCDIHRR